MEFQKNLTEIKSNREESASFTSEPCKLEINRLLFQYMPPFTTIADVEDLACAIHKTIEDGWIDFANVEAVRVEMMRKDR